MNSQSEVGAAPLFGDALLERAARFFHTLAEPSRLRLVQCLLEGRKAVSTLADETGLKQGNVSRQLSMLHDAGIVQREREGNFVHYSIREPLVFQLCELVCKALCERASREAKQFSR